MTNKVVVLGSLNVDTTLHIDQMPKPGETISAKSKTNSAGGKGANQAVAAARSGAQTSFIGQVGDDSNGIFMIDALKLDGINTDHVGINQVDGTGSAVILLDSQGQNSIMVYGDNTYDFRGLDKGTKYYFTIEPFNENGIGTKNKIIEIK